MGSIAGGFDHDVQLEAENQKLRAELKLARMVVADAFTAVVLLVDKDSLSKIEMISAMALYQSVDEYLKWKKVEIGFMQSVRAAILGDS